ncbi:MAG TPA: serine hydrolase [Clostridia bacterium]|nr:serine hydrolase [Clostridia bacterium]
MKNCHRKLFIALLLIVCMTASISGCSKEVFSAEDYWPTEGWKTSTPEAQGMDSATIDEMFNYARKSKLDIHSILIVRNGHLVTEGYFYPYSKEYRHILNSATKSITSALVGLALEDGFIKNIDQKVVDFFPDMKIGNLDDRKKSMTVRNLLMMTAGLEWNEDGSYGAQNDSNTRMWASENQLRYLLDRPMKEEPGKSFYYNSGASHVLSAIVQKTTGKTALEYVTERIFKPLGISDISWGADRQGINSGSGRVFMKPEDLAKYGYLYLNKGKWEGKQLIPEKWVEESTQKQIDTPSGLAGRHGYGYQWWQNKFGGYSARGFAGQYLFVVPEHNLVAVFTGGLAPEDFFEPERLMEDYIIPAIKGPKALDEDKAAYEGLLNTLESINKAPAKAAVPKLPEIAARISGKTYSMDNKETYSFEFKEGDECIMHWFCDGVMYDVKIGLDGVYRENDMDAFYWKGMTTKAGFRGRWTDGNTFVADLIPLEDCNIYRQEFRFDGDKLNAKMIQILNGAVSTNANGETAQ